MLKNLFPITAALLLAACASEGLTHYLPSPAERTSLENRNRAEHTFAAPQPAPAVSAARLAGCSFEAAGLHDLTTG
jgi:uncharacterized lipoprotein YmbA